MLKFAVTILAVLTTAACETTQGFGRDVQDAGQAIENEVE